MKKLKLKLATVQSEILALERKVDSLSNTSNDKLIAMKITKFCKERRTYPPTQTSHLKCSSASATAPAPAAYPNCISRRH